jgi:uncharacterized membrane protein
MGGVLMVSGALIGQQQRPASSLAAAPKFSPRYAQGFVYALLAAFAYGTSPIMTRTALQSAGPSSAVLGGLIAYGAATAVVTLMILLSPSLRRNITTLKRDNLRWFVTSGVFVALAQGFLYAAISVAPIMVVVPLLQLSLAFRFFFSMWLNPAHEVFGAKLVFGSIVSIVGACAVAIDTDLLLGVLGVPDAVVRLLRWQV